MRKGSAAWFLNVRVPSLGRSTNVSLRMRVSGPYRRLAGMGQALDDGRGPSKCWPQCKKDQGESRHYKCRGRPKTTHGKKEGRAAGPGEETEISHCASCEI